MQILNLASDGMSCNGGRMDFIEGAEFAFCYDQRIRREMPLPDKAFHTADWTKK